MMSNSVIMHDVNFNNMFSGVNEAVLSNEVILNVCNHILATKYDFFLYLSLYKRSLDLGLET